MPSEEELEDHVQLDLLRITKATVSYDGTRAVEDVSLSIREGERVGLIGPNGAGKSTLINVISGETRVQGGTVFFDGQLMDGVAIHERARRGLVRTYQEGGLFPSMTVLDNVLCGADRPPAGVALPFRWRSGPSRADQRAAAEDALSFVGLDSVAHEVVVNLPYGRRKLVELARAMAARPKILLLDEPVAGLNTAEKLEMVTRLEELLAAKRITMLLVEHDMRTMSRLCPQRVYGMIAGCMAAEGTFGEVMSDPQVVQAYLGGAKTI